MSTITAPAAAPASTLAEDASARPPLTPEQERASLAAAQASIASTDGAPSGGKGKGDGGAMPLGGSPAGAPGSARDLAGNREAMVANLRGKGFRGALEHPGNEPVFTAEEITFMEQNPDEWKKLAPDDRRERQTRRKSLQTRLSNWAHRTARKLEDERAQGKTVAIEQAKDAVALEKIQELTGREPFERWNGVLEMLTASGKVYKFGRVLLYQKAEIDMMQKDMKYVLLQYPWLRTILLLECPEISLGIAMYMCVSTKLSLYRALKENVDNAKDKAAGIAKANEEYQELVKLGVTA